MRYSRSSQVSTPAQQSGLTSNISSIPFWPGKFTAADGTIYPFVMAGSDPSRNMTTIIKTAIVPISLSFDGYVDPDGNNLVMDAGPAVKLAVTSPNFENSNYGTGFTQFADAVQRAEFFKFNKGDWHTLLSPPRMLTPVTIEVPASFAEVYITESGKIFAKIDQAFFVSQINTIAQLEGLRTDEIPILLAPNVLLYQNGDQNDCCLLGFHTAFETKRSSSTRYVQTLIWATWLDQGIYQDPDVADAITMSHELSETINDPFVNNVVPPWLSPDKENCQADLETADPIEVLPHPASNVMLHGFNYHPQTEALLQWFTQRPHSDAFENAWSFPDTRELTRSAKPCPQ